MTPTFRHSSALHTFSCCKDTIERPSRRLAPRQAVIVPVLVGHLQRDQSS